jgi:MFS family permease
LSLPGVEGKQGGYWELLRENKNFRTLWFGQISSLLGDWFNLIASAALISHLTQSGIAIGGLFVVRMLAPFLVSPLAGVVADRFNRRSILLLADLSRAAVVLGFLLVREPEHVWFLYGLTAIQLGIGGFFYPARNAILPDIVSQRDLGTANALGAVTWSIMLALGAALGGLVAGTWGIYQAFVIDSLSFVVSAVFIFRIEYESRLSRTAGQRLADAMLKQYLDGVRFLRRHLDILTIALHKAAAALVISSGFQVVQVAIADHVFPIGEGAGISLGLLFGLSGVGTGVGPILARKITGDQDRRLRVAILAGYLISATGLFIIGPLSSFPMVLFGTFLRGTGGGIIWVFSTQLLLQLVPNRVLGRVFSTEFAVFTLMSATGASVVGFFVDQTLGLSGTVWTMGCLSLIPALLWGLRLWFRK